MDLLNYAIYDTTGAITKALRVLNGDATTVPLNTRTGETALLTDIYPDPENYYVTGGVLTQRPTITSVATWNKTFIKADGSETATLGASLPNPSTINLSPVDAAGVHPVTQTVTDGSLSVSSSIVGLYNVEVSAFPYKKYSVIIGIGKGYVESLAIVFTPQEVNVSEALHIDTSAFNMSFTPLTVVDSVNVSTRVLTTTYDTVRINASDTTNVDTEALLVTTNDPEVITGYLVDTLTVSKAFEALVVGTAVYTTTATITETLNDVNVHEHVTSNTDYTPIVFYEVDVIIDERNDIDTLVYTLTFDAVTV